MHSYEILDQVVLHALIEVIEIKVTRVWCEVITTSNFPSSLNRAVPNVVYTFTYVHTTIYIISPGIV